MPFQYRSFFISLFFIVFTTPGSLALAECGNPTSPKELLDCVLKNDPRILASEEQVKRTEALARAAGAWPNPELEGQGSFAQDGSKGEKYSASLSQQLDWSGKIGAGAKAARMEYEAKKAENRLSRQEILSETVLRLVRLGQIADELEIAESQAQLCQRGLERFKKIAFLTSEQQTEKQALEWSYDRLKLQIIDLESERDDISLELSVSLGGQEIQQGLILPPKDRWPDWPAINPSPSFLLATKNRREGAKAEVGKEHAASWPSLSLGPVFEREGDNVSKTDFFGARVSLGLPLWDQNGGNRDAAESGLREAKINESSAEKRLALTRRLLKTRYEKSVEKLNELSERNEKASKKLEFIRSSYLNGRISLSLALEAYRELEELIRHYHEAERIAYESLWRGYTLEDVAETKEP